ncbi:MAG: lipoate--protein ligase [Desulfobacterales bacterium]
MIFLVHNNHSNDPSLNLALEEFCLRRFAPDRLLLLLYVNHAAVIIGRNQNFFEEVDLAFAARRNLHLMRRISGGGAVYHDAGNVNFSFIQPHHHGSLKDIRRTIEPVRQALVSLGVAAEFNAKSDILVDGKKVSGSAQFSNTKRMVVHGTLLFNSHLNDLRHSLTPNSEVIRSRAPKSEPSAVTNLAGCMAYRIGIDDFRAHLLRVIAAHSRGLQPVRVSGRDWRCIRRLAHEKYRSWQWNFGKTPAFRIRRAGETTGALPAAVIDVEGGRISAIHFENTHEKPGRAGPLEMRLIGAAYHRQAICAGLSGVDLSGFGPGVTAGQVAKHLCDHVAGGFGPGLQTA